MIPGARRIPLVWLLLPAFLSGCLEEPVRQLVVRNDTDRSLAVQVLALAAPGPLGTPAPLLDPADPGLAAEGFVFLAPGQEAARDAPSPGDGVAVVIYVDRGVPDGTYAFSDTQTWPERDLRDAAGRVRIVSYRRVG